MDRKDFKYNLVSLAAILDVAPGGQPLRRVVLMIHSKYIAREEYYKLYSEITKSTDHNDELEEIYSKLDLD